MPQARFDPESGDRATAISRLCGRPNASTHRNDNNSTEGNYAPCYHWKLREVELGKYCRSSRTLIPRRSRGEELRHDSEW